MSGIYGCQRLKLRSEPLKSVVETFRLSVSPMWQSKSIAMGMKLEDLLVGFRFHGADQVEGGRKHRFTLRERRIYSGIDIL